MKIRIEHIVLVTVEEHTEEHQRAELAIQMLRMSNIRARSSGFVTYRIEADDFDDVCRICQEMGK